MLEKAQIHVIDFEGTRESGILEYGVVTMDENIEICQTYTRLCKNIGQISRQEGFQHGIGEEELEGKEEFSAEWELFSSLRRNGPFAAHHAQVENNLLKAVWPYTKESPDFVNIGGLTNEWGPWIDSCQLYKSLYTDLENHKLMNLVGIFSLNSALEELGKKYCPEGRQKHHCALYDAIASALLIKKAVEVSNLGLEGLIRYSQPQKVQEEMGQLGLGI